MDKNEGLRFRTVIATNSAHGTYIQHVAEQIIDKFNLIAFSTIPTSSRAVSKASSCVSGSDSFNSNLIKFGAAMAAATGLRIACAIKSLRSRSALAAFCDPLKSRATRLASASAYNCCNWTMRMGIHPWVYNHGANATLAKNIMTPRQRQR